MNQDDDPKLALLTKVLLVISTSSSTRPSWVIRVLWWVVWMSFVSPDRMMTAPQLNSLEWIEHRIGTVIVAGEEIVWMTELLELLPVQVSFNVIVPENSNLNVSEMTSVEGMELALIAVEAVQIRPITWEDRPNRSVSRDNTESSGMMK